MALRPNPASTDASGWAPRLAAVLWPLGASAPDRLSSWYTACALLVIPLTAILHHLFQGHRCILNTYGRDYDLATVRKLFLHDPSLPWAIAVMVLVYHVGRRSSAIRRAAVPAFAASLPLSLWLWDIPFTSQVVCRHFHDGRALLAPGVPLTTLWIYGLCLLVYLAFQYVLFRRGRRIPLPDHSAAPALSLPKPLR
ncbi:MAG TPA: hypothetical protein VGH38_00615 [Bryobacteraceae bacterium]|jgi:hypothetical protein